MNTRTLSGQVQKIMTTKKICDIESWWQTDNALSAQGVYFDSLWSWIRSMCCAAIKPSFVLTLLLNSSPSLPNYNPNTAVHTGPPEASPALSHPELPHQNLDSEDLECFWEFWLPNSGMFLDLPPIFSPAAFTTVPLSGWMQNPLSLSHLPLSAVPHCCADEVLILQLLSSH